MHRLNPQKGIGWFLLSRFCFALSASIIKFFPYSVFQFNFIRGVFTCLVLGPYLYFKQGTKAFKVKRPFFMMIRIVVGVTGILCYYYTFQLMDFAKAVTIASTQTFLTPVLAKIFLHEKIGIYRSLAIGIGYIGVFFALDPNHTGIDYPEWIAIIHVLLNAASNILTKKLLLEETPEATMFYVGITSIVVIGLLWLFEPYWSASFHFRSWPSISLEDFFILLGIFGTLGFIAQFGYLKAYTYADLSLLTPYEYSSFIFATLIGFFFFGEIPEITTWIAMVFIILATTLLASLETSRHKRLKKSVPS